MKIPPEVPWYTVLRAVLCLGNAPNFLCVEFIGLRILCMSFVYGCFYKSLL